MRRLTAEIVTHRHELSGEPLFLEARLAAIRGDRDAAVDQLRRAVDIQGISISFGTPTSTLRRCEATRRLSASCRRRSDALIAQSGRRDGAHIAPAEPTDLRPDQNTFGAIWAFPFLSIGRGEAGRWRRDSNARLLGKADCGLHLATELERVGDAVELFLRSAGSGHGDRAEPEEAAAHSLVDADSLDLGQHRLERAPTDPTDFDDDALVRHREFRRHVLHPGPTKGCRAEDREGQNDPPEWMLAYREENSGERKRPKRNGTAKRLR